MRRFILFLIIVFSINGIALCQNNSSVLSADYTAGILERIKKLNYLSQKNAKNASRDAVSYGKEALVLSETINDRLSMAVSLMNIGVAYRYLQALDVSMEYLLRAHKIFAELGNENYTAQVLERIGSVYFSLGYLDKALNYHNRALEIYQKTGDKPGISSALNGIGLVYDSKQDFKKALDNLKKSYSIEKKRGSKEGLARILNNLGIVYSDMGLYEKSLPLFEEALNIHTKSDDTWGVVEVLNNLGVVYTKLGYNKKALSVLSKARKIAGKIQDRNLLLDNYLYSAELYEALGMYKEAVRYRKLHHKFYKMVASDKKKDNVAELQVLFATEKKDAEIKLLQSERELKIETIRAQRFWISFIVSVLLFILVGSSLIIIHSRNKLRMYKILAKKNIKIVEYGKIIGEGDKEALKRIRRLKLKDEIDQTKEQDEVKYSHSNLTEEQKEKIFDSIVHIIEDEKYFLRHDATLANVAKELGVNRSYISQVINEEFGKSFSNVINEYRVQEARRLLAEDSSRIFTIASVAKSVGFNSINVFNKAFKKYTGITPSFFVNSLHQNEFQSEISSK